MTNSFSISRSPRTRPHRSQPHRRPPRRHRLHRPHQLPLRPPARRQVRSSHRRHRPRPLRRHLRAGDLQLPPLARPYAGTKAPTVGGPYGPYRQSERTEIYASTATFCSPTALLIAPSKTAEELEALRQRQIAAKLPPRYAGAHRDLSQCGRSTRNLAAGRPFVVRMKGPRRAAPPSRDELRGDITFEHNNVDDQVLMKSDGFPTYHLANVVDDHLMHITDVIRAEEWISSTPKHVLALSAPSAGRYPASGTCLCCATRQVQNFETQKPGLPHLLSPGGLPPRSHDQLPRPHGRWHARTRREIGGPISRF